MTAEHWTSAQARSIALAAAGLTNRSAPHFASEVLGHLGAVQLDTISVLARSHELVHHARVDGLTRKDIETALWASPPHSFEYWSHAACVLPLADYHLFAFRRRWFARRGERWHGAPAQRTLNNIVKRLADGPVTTTDLGGAKKSGEWWDWSESKIAIEWLLDTGVAICTERIGWRRVYRLAADVIPAVDETGWVTIDGVYGPTDDHCIDELLHRSIRTLGIGTIADIADVHRLRATNHSIPARLANLVERGQITQCSVQGWNQPAFRDIRALPNRETSRTTLLSPFDSLVWYRERLERIFAMNYRIEAYTPAAKRVHGYFAMPVLHRGELIARVDPGREGRGASSVLVAKTVTFEGKPTPEAIEGTATALRRATKWVGASSIRVDTVAPASAARPLRAAVRD